MIEALAKTGADAAALRAMVASSLSRRDDGGPVDRTRLERTLIVSVAKGPEAQPGDRLMRTIVTIRPHRRDGGAAPFEFAGYTIVKTDYGMQNIAHLETKTDASLTGTLSPKVGGFGDNSLVGSLSRSHTSSADIAQQYENLNVDIVPDRLTVTRESERGLDVVGNTIVALTLAMPPLTDAPNGLLAASATLFSKGKPLAPADASIDVRPMHFLRACPLLADVELRYQLRHIVGGREYYTEGKQSVAIASGTVAPAVQTLVRGEDVSGPLYEIRVDVAGRPRGAIIASLPHGEQNLLLFDDYDEANALAVWLKGRGEARIGDGGTLLNLGNRPIPKGATLQPVPYRLACPR
jgi:hypothetical protein